jgi:MFS family permease
MINQLELVLIFGAVIIGVISAGYFYTTSGIFNDLLKKPLKIIASGMFIIAIGVLLAAFISFEAEQGITVLVYGIPLSAAFYITYIIGSVMIAIGARHFSSKPKTETVMPNINRL